MKALLLLTAVLAAPLLAHADPLVRPDVMKAVQAHRDGRLDEALALIKGCFDHIAAGDSGAQHSYFITMFEWTRLTMDYAPARQALIAERDVQAGKLLAGDANFAGEGYTAISRFQLIAEMNQFLQDERLTYSVFTRLLDDFPDLARREARTALPAIVEAGDYRLALRYLDENPLRKLDELNRASRKLPLYPPPSEPPEVASQLQNFVNDVTLRTKTLKGLGKEGEAEQLRNAALAGIELAEVRALAEQEFSKPGSIYRTLAEHQATEAPPKVARLLENATGAADVYVDKTGIRVDDTPLQSPDELIALLAARNVKTARLHRTPDAGFENIGKVIYAVMRAGGNIDIGKPEQ